MNGAKLKQVIADRGIKKQHLASCLGITANAFSAKLAGKTDFKRGEIDILRDELRMSDAEFLDVFFN